MAIRSSRAGSQAFLKEVAAAVHAVNASAGLTGGATLASVVPASRGGSVDPMWTLRSEWSPHGHEADDAGDPGYSPKHQNLSRAGTRGGPEVAAPTCVQLR
jgi:hypothetical protein